MYNNSYDYNEEVSEKSYVVSPVTQDMSHMRIELKESAKMIIFECITTVIEK